MARKSKTAQQARFIALQRGIKKHWKDGKTLANKKYTQADLLAFLQNLRERFAAVGTARAAYKEALAKRKEAEREAAPVLTDIEAMVDGEFGDAVVPRADFGLGPRRKKGPKTTQAKVLMVERARATRKKRGTMGKRQRKKIRGW
jgi:hypothetical protein